MEALLCRLGSLETKQSAVLNTLRHRDDNTCCVASGELHCESPVSIRKNYERPIEWPDTYVFATLLFDAEFDIHGKFEEHFRGRDRLPASLRDEVELKHIDAQGMMFSIPGASPRRPATISKIMRLLGLILKESHGASIADLVTVVLDLVGGPEEADLLASLLSDDRRGASDVLQHRMTSWQRRNLCTDYSIFSVFEHEIGSLA